MQIHLFVNFLNKYSWTNVSDESLCCSSENPLPSTHHINWRGQESVSLGNMHNRRGAYSVAFSQACFCFFRMFAKCFDSNCDRKLCVYRWQRSALFRFIHAGEQRGQVCFHTVLYEISHDSHKQIKDECAGKLCLLCVYLYNINLCRIYNLKRWIIFKHYTARSPLWDEHNTFQFLEHLFLSDCWNILLPRNQDFKMWA